jgi:hypothetical protein
LIGEAGATLQMANSQNSSFLITPSGGGTNITLHGLTIDGNKANNTAGSAIVFGGKNITIDGCVVKNTAEAGILLAPTSDHTAGNNAVRNCYILNPSLASNNWGGIGITGSAGALVRGNTIESTEGYMTYGIAVEPDNGTATNEITKIVISDNIIKGGRLFVDGGNLSSPLPLVTVQNNIVDARGSKGNSYDNDAPLYCRKVRGLVVQGNTTRDNLSSTSPFRAAVLEGISDFAFVSNVHYATTNSTAGLTRRAVYFSNTTTSSDGLVANNVIVSEQGQCEYGIYAYNGGSPLAITNVDYFNNKIVNFTTPTLP